MTSSFWTLIWRHRIVILRCYNVSLSCFYLHTCIISPVVHAPPCHAIIFKNYFMFEDSFVTVVTPSCFVSWRRPLLVEISREEIGVLSSVFCSIVIFYVDFASTHVDPPFFSSNNRQFVAVVLFFRTLPNDLMHPSRIQRHGHGPELFQPVQCDRQASQV